MYRLGMVPSLSLFLCLSFSTFNYSPRGYRRAQYEQSKDVILAWPTVTWRCYVLFYWLGFCRCVTRYVNQLNFRRDRAYTLYPMRAMYSQSWSNYLNRVRHYGPDRCGCTCRYRAEHKSVHLRNEIGTKYLALWYTRSRFSLVAYNKLQFRTRLDSFTVNLITNFKQNYRDDCPDMYTDAPASSEARTWECIWEWGWPRQGRHACFGPLSRDE